MPESFGTLRPIAATVGQLVRGSLAALRDVLRGAAGANAYENYLSHCAAHHPSLVPLSREAFFRLDLAARWDGVRRCC